MNHLPLPATRLVRPICVWIAVGLLCCAGLVAQAAEPELVGVVALLTEEAVAKELGLSEDQREKLYDLADERELAGIRNAIAVKDLPREERLKKLSPFRAATTQQGLALLTPAQRAKLPAIVAKQTDAAYSLEVAAPVVERAPVVEPAVGKEVVDEEVMVPAKAEQSQVNAAETAPAAKPMVSQKDGLTLDANGDGKLSFNFRYQPWSDVLDWFAEQADLSLVLESPPPGTFNYRDGRAYTPAEALDVLNSVLLTKGYTLVRKGRMLLVINLEDGIPPNLVTDVPLAELDDRGDYELVRVLFRVHNMPVVEVQEELQKLIGPQGTVLVLPKAGMIQVTETAGRIRTIRSVIEAIEQPRDGGDGVQEFRLKHATANELLPVVRPMLGIPAEAMATATGTLQLAVDPLGEKLYATGTPEQIRRLQDVLRVVDVPDSTDVSQTPQLEVYSSGQADSQLVLNVLQTLLSGSNTARLAADEQTGNLVALATPAEHATIRTTLAQLQQDARQIEVIPLQLVDPQLAVLAINRLFPPATIEEGVIDPQAPIVDADLNTRSLMVRANPTQLSQIKSLLEKLGENESAAAAASSGNIRLLPMVGTEIQSALTQIERLWPSLRTNKIRIVTPSSAIPTYRPGRNESEAEPGFNFLTPDLLEQLRAMPPQGEELDPQTRSYSRIPARFAAEQVDLPVATKPAGKPGAEIVVSPGPGGTIIASEDLEALDQFESLLRATAGQSTNGRQLAVFYLKYAKATDAAVTLGKVFGSGDAGGGGLMGGIADAALGDMGGGLMGDILGLGGGGSSSSGFLSASVELVADVRLNALIVYAQTSDLDTVDQLLKILDQRTGPEAVEAGGKPRLIALEHTQAADVAEVVKQVYSDRMQGAGGSGGQPSPEQLLKALKGGAGGGDEPDPAKMSIGIDARSNSLVVRAPDPLFEDVEALVKQLDEEGLDTPQATRVVSLEHSNAESVKEALASLLGDKAVVNSSAGNNQAGSNNRGNRGNNQNRNAQQNSGRATQQQIEMFRRLRNMQRAAGGGGRGGGGNRGGGQRGGGGGRGGR